jgi:hypothetical protein
MVEEVRAEPASQIAEEVVLSPQLCQVDLTVVRTLLSIATGSCKEGAMSYQRLVICQSKI